MYFHHHSEDRQTDLKLESNRCTGTVKSGAQCKRNVIIGQKTCHLHRVNKKVQQSTVPAAGKGLFAYRKNAPANAIIFKNKDHITDYNGEVINTAELLRRYGDYTGEYAIQIDRNTYEDGARTRGLGTLVNHSGNKKKVNAKFSVKRTKRIALVATKNIRNNTEIFINYGDEYQFNEPGTCNSTNRKKHVC